MSDFVEPRLLKWEWEEYKKDRERLDWLLATLNRSSDLPVWWLGIENRDDIDTEMAK